MRISGPTSLSFVLAPALLAAFLLQVLLADAAPGYYDEGLTLYGAARIMQADAPYRDFWTLYGPASFYVLGYIFKLFGPSLLASRLLDAALRVVIALLVYFLARRVTGSRSALGPAFSSTFLLIAADGYNSPVYAALAFALLAILLAAYSFGSKHPALLSFLSGACAGVGFLHRTDFGVYAFLSVASSYLLWSYRTKQRWRLWLMPMASGFVGVVLPAAILMIQNIPLANLYDDLIRIPFTIYGPNRSLPFPVRQPFWEMVVHRTLWPAVTYGVYLPPVLITIALWLYRPRDPNRDLSVSRLDINRTESALVIYMVICMTAFCVLKAVVRMSLGHMMPALVCSTILGTVIVQKITLARLRAALTFALPAYSLILCLSPEYGNRWAPRLNGEIKATCAEDEIPRLRCFMLDPPTRAVVNFVRAHTADDDAIYVGAGRHDKLLVNHASLYFLSGRKSSTRWFDLHPGVQTSAEIQREVIADFVRDPPKLVILDTSMDRVREPNASAISSGNHLLDEWIQLHYEPVFVAGQMTIMKPQAVP